MYCSIASLVALSEFILSAVFMCRDAVRAESDNDSMQHEQRSQYGNKTRPAQPRSPAIEPDDHTANGYHPPKRGYKDADDIDSLSLHSGRSDVGGTVRRLPPAPPPRLPSHTASEHTSYRDDASVHSLPDTYAASEASTRQGGPPPPPSAPRRGSITQAGSGYDRRAPPPPPSSGRSSPAAAPPPPPPHTTHPALAARRADAMSAADDDDTISRSSRGGRYGSSMAGPPPPQPPGAAALRGRSDMGNQLRNQVTGNRQVLSPGPSSSQRYDDDDSSEQGNNNRAQAGRVNGYGLRNTNNSRDGRYKADNHTGDPDAEDKDNER